MKKMILITMALLIAGAITSSGQTQDTQEKQIKKDQSELANDVYISYGIGTVYYFIENNGYQANFTPGTFLAGFSRSINKVIAVGFQLSYTQIERTGTDYLYDPYYNSYTIDIQRTDNLWQGMANVRFRYLNTPTFSMYSGIGMGVTMDYYKDFSTTEPTTKGQKLLPAAQLTLLGFRVGRTLSFFGEFGVGTNSILTGGMSYKFGE